MTQEKKYTWDDLVAAVGQDFSGGEVRTSVDEVERGAIRKYCEPVEMDCPLFHDDEVAKQHGYKGIISPISAISSSFSGAAIWAPGDATRWPTSDPDGLAQREVRGATNVPPLPIPQTNAGFATDIEIEYFAPAYVGDRLITSGRKLVEVNLRETRVGYGAFMIFESEVRNQHGELVARMRNGSYSYIAGAKAE